VKARWTTLGGVSTAVVALLLAVAGSASATTTCDYSAAGKLLSINLPADNDGAQIRRVANDIVVGDASLAPITCAGGTPTVTNTDAISAFNQPGGQGNVLSIAGPKSFGPGATPEAGGDEIEVFVNLNDEANGGVILQPGGDSAGENVRFGKDGINLNATPTEDQPDVDVFLNGAPISGAAGGPGPDNLSAQGGAGTGSTLTNTIVLDGREGADVLTGGDGDDLLFGGGATNTLLGMDGSDTLFPGPNDDAVDGGAETDTVEFVETAISVSVDLAIAGPQSTGGGNDSLTNVENLRGTEGPDVLRGDGGPNTLSSGIGNDVLDGRGGVDRLDAGEDADSLVARDGRPDTADCGEGADSAAADAAGVDTLVACESVSFPPAPGPDPGPDPGGGEPSNDFAFGKVKKNKRMGTATLPVEVPGSGTLDLAGKSLKADSEEASGAGEVKLKIKAKGKKKAKLNKRGRTKVKPAVTYTPTGGAPNTQSVKVKLVKR
jgi:Ca2+-binding RTX toxin-like protein